MQKTITIHEATISYQIKGEGEAILLQHGFGESSAIWEEWQEPLLSGYKVVTPDLPGFGNSTLPAEELTIDQMAEAVIAILQEEAIDNPLLIGHSMGGYVILAMEEKAPMLSKGFGFFHSTAYADTEDKIRNRKKAIRLIEQYGCETFVKEWIPNLFGKSFVEGAKDQVEDMIQRAQTIPAQSLVAGYRAMMQRPDRNHVLAGNQKPVLFIGGKEDRIIPSKDVVSQALLPRQASLFLLENAGHMGMLEAKRETQEAMRQYLELVEAPEFEGSA